MKIYDTVGIGEISKNTERNTYSVVFSSCDLSMRYIDSPIDYDQYKSVGSVGLYDKEGNLCFVIEQFRKRE